MGKIILKLLLLSTVFGVFGMYNQIYAATTTISYAGSASDLGDSTMPWTSVSNAIGNTTGTSANNILTARRVNSNTLSLTNFDLSTAGLPIGSTINGIQVDVEWQGSNTRVRDTVVQLTKDGTSVVGSNYAANVNSTATKLIDTYGGLADLWGTSWTESELSSSTFGVHLRYENRVNTDHNVDVFRVGITIDYTPNNVPTDITLSNQDIPSAIPIGSLVGSASTTDADVGDSHTYSLGCTAPGADDASFSISGADLLSNEVFDHTVKSTYNICLRTDDARTGVFDKNFVITILAPVPNSAPTDITLSNNDILELVQTGSLVGSLSTTDVDVWDSHSYDFTCTVPGVDDSSFAISGSDLISYEVFDQSIKSTYNICIRTDDGNGGTFDKNFVITILVNLHIGYAGAAADLGGGTFSWANPNNAIGDTTSTSTTLTINVRNSYSNYLSLTDFNLFGSGLPTNAIIEGIQVDVELMASGNGMKDSTFQLTKDGINPVGSNYGNYVNRSQTKSITTYGGPADLWGTTWSAAELISSDFGVYLQYRNTNANSRDLDIYRVNVIVTYNTPPSDIGLTSDNIDEGLTIGSNVGVLSTVDPDIGDTHSYDFTCSVAGVDDASFSIAGSNLNSNEVFNADVKTTYNICIRTDDGNGGVFDENIVISINDINQDPTDITLSNNSIVEGLSIGTLVGTLGTVDGDLGDTHTYNFSCSIPGADDSNFAISGGNLNSNIIFDFATQSIHNICIRTNDGNGGTFDENFIINIDQLIISPGGVGTNLQIWLKADQGPSTSIDGNAVTTWNDQSGNGFNAGGGVSPIYRDNTTDELNFHPVIDFNGTTQYLENTANGAYSQSYFAVIVPDNTVDASLGGQVPFSFECLTGLLNTGTCGLPFGGLTLGAFTAAINDEVITHAIGASTDWRSAQIGVGSYQVSKPMLVNMNENATSDGTEISEKGAILDNYNANIYQTLSATDYRLGRSMDAANPFIYDGKIAEIINYSSRITPINKSKIESYLSIKYGMTIDSGLQDYIASDGVTDIWTTATAGTYINDIFGIGRDNQSELTQVKSKSVNDGSIITLEAVGEGTNASPAFVDIVDKEFLTISNDGAGNTWGAADTPVGYYSLTRKWRVQESGEVGTVNLYFDVDDVDFDVPALSTGSNYYFIYDSNNNNSLADETPTAMTNISGSIWQISGFDLNNAREFTIATQASSNNIPTDITLSNDSINENVIATSTIGTLTTTDADLGDSHTYSFVSGVGDEDNVYLNIAGSTLSIVHSPDYEIKQTYNIRVQTDDGNGGQYQKTFVISINNLGESVPSSLDFENALDDYKYSNTSGIWARSTNNPYEGSYSLESDNLGTNNTQSCFQVDNTLTQTGTINFYYNVSSELNSDYLRFYIDNVEQQAWTGTVPWTLYEKLDVTPGAHIYKWCYIKDGGGAAGTDNAYIDFVATQPTTGESNPPVISSINFATGSLLPGGNHDIVINYSDAESGIDTGSDSISLYKWNGSVWGADISATGLDLGSKIVNATSATYPTNNLDYGKYRYDFQISDNDFNTSSTGATFYIDEPLITIGTGALDLGTLPEGSLTFSSDEILITVQTVGAGYQVHMSKDTDFVYTGSGIIIDWDGLEGVGYDQEIYSGTNQDVNSNPVLATQVSSINIDGDYNTYVYKIKIGTLIGELQAAGNYSMNLSFYLYLNY